MPDQGSDFVSARNWRPLSPEFESTARRSGRDEVPEIEGSEGAEEPDAGRRAREDAAVEAHKRVVKDLRIVRVGLDDLSVVWRELAEAANSPSDLLDDLREAVDRLVAIVDALVAAGVGQSSDRALEAVTTMSALQDGVAEMQAGTVRSGSAGAGGLVAKGQPVSKILAWIMKTLSRAAKWLCVLISHLLTPKEWSLTGGIGLPGLANASISVTFG